ncbi:MAG: ScyD/ScyE family protein [Nocardioidaceae bacterium]
MTPTTKRRRLIPACALGIIALAAPAVVSANASQAPPPDPLAKVKHKVVADGLDNPRQLTVTPSKRLLVAQAGRGGQECVGEGQDEQCAGTTGKVTQIGPNGQWNPMAQLLSFSGSDGSFAVGSDGASKRPGGRYFAIMTYAPPEFLPPSLPSDQLGKLLAKRPGGKLRSVANIAKYEANHDPDGEGVESNPYSVLALRQYVLVADAAGDTIYKVRHGHLRVFHQMKEYGKKVDAVPTTLALDKRTGRILVGELHSEIPGKAKVWSLRRDGSVHRTWKGFTTITGVARARNGTLYVSELFGGDCGFDQIPECFPGRVVRIKPNGNRKTFDVPFPAGIVVRNGNPFVSAFSISPGTGFGGNPDWSGQIWRLG